MIRAMSRVPLLLVWLLLAAQCASLAGAARGRDAPPAMPPQGKGLDRKQLGDELQKLVESAALRRARFGVCVRDLTDEEWLFEHNAEELLAVASNNKLATTAAALELLGPDFQFRTTVWACGALRSDGVLVGDLVVVGRGDPSISGRFHEGKPLAVLEQWAEAVAQAGIKKVQGGVIADDTYFDRQHTHPGWPQGQHEAWYCAPVSALSFNDNCTLVVVKPGPKEGAPAVASVEPPTSYFEIANAATTSRARLGNNRIVAHRRLGTNRIAVTGEIRHQGAPFTTWMTVHDPALYTAAVFADLLRAKGIPVAGPVRLLTPPLKLEPARLREIITTASALKDAVAVANTNSQNFYAEQMLKTLGREKGGKGTWAAGAEAVEGFLRSAKVTGAFSYTDGSGLARADRFSARQLVQLLGYANGRRWGNRYLGSLAEPGEEGTLSRRLDALKGRLFAKTGYIASVSALSGYVESRGNRLLAFSVLVNDFRCSLSDVRAFQDALCLKLAEYDPQERPRGK
ncbi:MAG: D-alanyl-D-alanine carboxypeptidase/D-alanyl-D-alanine-endopeptidase [Planctomycetes bacterium]|nr:D-alanyl-D-alanine carboxypeptidase/D-alanyl-D-alanine-endopeptidase [Planctomycetota bacterium]